MLVRPESVNEVGRNIPHDHTTAYRKDTSTSLVILNDDIKSDILLGEPVKNSLEYRPNSLLPIVHGDRANAQGLI
jgi:hypothetical protein